MCYSKEVSLTAGTLMVSGVTYTWRRYVQNQSDAIHTPVYRNILMGYFCIALHQFADFLSIAMGNEMIYKMGLIASISCMFFYMRSLEKLSKLSFGSRVFALLIVLCAIEIFSSRFIFENKGFWVRGEGETYLFWAGMWMALYIYWNVCLLYYRSLNLLETNRWLLINYGMYTINLSYLLYSGYAYFSLFMKEASLNGLIHSGNVFSSFDLVKDSPSIWCAFSVIQVFFIPVLFRMMNTHYHWQASLKVAEISWKTIFKLLGMSALIWFIFLGVFPLFFGAAAKMVMG